MKFHFHVDNAFQSGISRLESLLNFAQAADGIPVYAVCGDRIGASLIDGIGTIYYQKKHHFFRELGVFVENTRKSASFDLTEDSFFETIGVMFNMSNMAPSTVEGTKELLDYLAVMGYNMMMLYTEDTIKLESRPCFGLFRGRYTPDDLRAIDDYAFAYGIEVIPCLECLGHMSAYLKWDEAKPIKDTSSVLLARAEETYAFLDELIKTASSCLRSKRIHIGMDEAHDAGRGAFLDRYGYVPRAQIFHEHMARLVQITNRYGLTPMMWSDMYFRINAEDGFQYYQKDLVVSEETKQAIPKEVQLVYWHYGEEPKCDEYMIEKHQDMNRDVIFAGGLWDWSGLFPENNYAYEATSYSLRACRKYGVREMMMTSWSSGNLYANLLGLSMAAELCYEADASAERRKERFEACTGGDYDAFMRMSNYHNKFGADDIYPDFNQRFLGRAIFWQDILEGLYEAHLKGRPMSGFYRENAEAMKQYHGKFESLYRLAEKVFEYLAVKSEVAENLVNAYKAGDRKTLARYSEELIPAMKEQLEQIRVMHRAQLRKLCTTITWGELDCRYGGMAARCETVKLLIDEYLCGQIDRIDELEEPHIPKPLSAFGSIATFVGK